MTTVREHIEAAAVAARALAVFHAEGAIAAAELRDAIAALDEAETAWRNDGSTYRLVPDTVEVPA